MMELNKYIFTLCIPVFLICGCQANTRTLSQNNIQISEKTKDKTDDSALSELEKLNIANDTDLFIQFNNQMMDEVETLTKKEAVTSEKIKELFGEKKADEGETKKGYTENQIKARYAISNYLNNVYNLALSRLSSNVGTAYVYSEEYMNYLALLQVFADSYTDNKDEIQKNIQDGLELNEECMEYLSEIEGYYLSVFAEI